MHIYIPDIIAAARKEAAAIEKAIVEGGEAAFAKIWAALKRLEAHHDAIHLATNDPTAAPRPDPTPPAPTPSRVPLPEVTEPTPTERPSAPVSPPSASE